MNSPLRTRLGVFVAVAASLCAAALSSGQETIARYTLNTDNNSTVSSSLATVSAFTYGSGGGARTTSVAGTGLDGQLGSHVKANASAIAGSLEDAISGNQYVGFTITPTQSLNILSLDFDFAVVNNSSTVDPYTGSWSLFAGPPAFVAVNSLASGFVSTPKSSGGSASWNSITHDLQGVSSLQSVALSPIEFRLYFWDNSTASSSTAFSIRFDDVGLTASAIPEPSTYAALIGLAALGFVALRRRQTRSV